jgi:hypothetical protein
MDRKIGTGHIKPPADAAPRFHIEPDDLRAARAAATQLPPNFSVQEAERAATQGFARSRRARRQGRKELRKAMQGLFQIYVATAASTEQQEKFKSDCIHKGIILRSGTHLATAVVRYYYERDSAEAVNRYAYALREAAHRKVVPHKLAAYLGKKGQGINSLADAYEKRQKRAAEMSEASDDSDNGRQTTARGKSRKPDGSKRCRESEDIIIRWARAKAGKFIAVEPGTRLLRWIEKVDDDSGNVLQVSRRRKNDVGRQSESILVLDLSAEVRRAS